MALNIFIISLLIFTLGFSSNHIFDFDPAYAASTTITISSSGNGCNHIGEWDSHTKTCLMKKNFKGFIDIVGSHITLDGNGFLISSEYDSTTLKENGDPRNRVIDVKGSDVTIKNVFVKGFPVNGIYGMFNTEIYSVGIGTNFPNLVVKDSSFSNHGYGIAVVPAPEIWDERECLIENNKVFSNSQVGISTLGCTIKNNEINDNYIGISDQSAGQNIILENHIHHNGVGINPKNSKIMYNTLQENYNAISFYRSEKSLTNNNFLNNFQTELFGFENYYDNFDSKREGCQIIPQSNFCQNALGEEHFFTGDEKIDSNYDQIGSLKSTFKVQDKNPWHIKDGWLYDLQIPENIQTTSENPEGKSVNFAVSGSSPNGAVSVTCNPSSNSFFPVGQTQVICSTPNGFVSTFFVTVLDQKIVEQKQFEESAKSSSIGLLKVLSLGLGIFVIILIFRMRKRKNRFKEKYASQQYQSQSYSHKQPYEKSSYQESYTYEEPEDNYFESDYESSQSNSSTGFDPQNLSKEEAFQILEVTETSTRQEIRNSRNRLINQWHPDKHRTPLYRETAEKNTKLIISAYELLRELGYVD